MTVLWSRQKLLLTTMCLLWAGTPLYGVMVTVLGEPTVPQVAFAVDDIEQALLGRRLQVKLGSLTSLPKQKGSPLVVLAQEKDTKVIETLKEAGARLPTTMQAEGFCLRVTRKLGRLTTWVIGRDAAGLMYGGLELAEIIRVAGLDAAEDMERNPYMALRGIKFNCPLDVRTPSYTDVCDAAQHNIGQMWSFDFWREYIDTLARYRYNYVSLWSLHPFPSLVKVPDYPKVALADVQRSTVKWEEHYPLQGYGFCDPEIIDNVEVLKRMSIEDKIAFWRKVMRYGKERNVDFYFVTWNIFVYGTQGQYGITDEIDNKTTRDYFRKSVKQMFVTYPDLAGIGLTTGENMHGASFEEKEDWAFDTYARGVLDAAQQFPGRKITFIHRQHQTGALDIADKFKPLIDHPDIEFIFSFKYAKAHVYSSTTQPYHPGFVKDIQSRGDLKTIWTLRNDDIYHFRWGAPDFVREFIQNIPYDVSRGYYYGSDQYIWGREFMSTEPEEPRQLEIVKHWYHWLLWGRLGYDPTLTNGRFTKILQHRFPEVSGRHLLNAWQEASWVYPKVTGFHWGALDFQWYIESSQSMPGPAQTPSGFHDINRFISLKPHATTGYVSIPDYVKAVQNNKQMQGTTPIALSDQIHGHADEALGIINRLKTRDNKELRLTLGDIRSIAYMGKYYAHKIRAATEWALFRAITHGEHQAKAVEEMRQAALYWRLYASNALTQYTNPLWTNRVGYVDWRKNMDHVLYDLTIVGGDRRIPSLDPSPGGTILEAEGAQLEGAVVATKQGGFTGSGYVEVQGSGNRHWVEWNFDTEKPGSYLLELRYTLRWTSRASCRVSINDRDCSELILWKESDQDVWVWDREAVTLKHGRNQIRVTVPHRVKIDHVNILYGGSTAIR